MAVFMTGSIAMAQHGGPRGNKRGMAKDLTPAQLATLQTKKMTLALDLTAEQQSEVLRINTEDIEARQAEHEELKQMRLENDQSTNRAEAQFARQKARLDSKIARQEKLKEVLNAQQYAQWKKMNRHLERNRRQPPQ